MLSTRGLSTHRSSFRTPLGWCTVETRAGCVSSVRFSKPYTAAPSNDPLHRRASREILEYLGAKRRRFTLCWSAVGTPFQRIVWKQLVTIPYGETRTYSDIASAIGKSKASRAVGNAVGKNPLPILIPCHRVVRKDGLGGFTAGVRKKMALLKLEKGIPPLLRLRTTSRNRHVRFYMGHSHKNNYSHPTDKQ